VALYLRELERQTGSREVTGMSLTHGTAEYSPGQAACAHVPLSPSSILWYYWKSGDALKLERSGITLAMHHILWYIICVLKGL